MVQIVARSVLCLAALVFCWLYCGRLCGGSAHFANRPIQCDDGDDDDDAAGALL